MYSPEAIIAPTSPNHLGDYAHKQPPICVDIEHGDCGGVGCPVAAQPTAPMSSLSLGGAATRRWGGAQRNEMSNEVRQAIVIVHGMGEQRPLETLKGFIDAALPGPPSELHSRPDKGAFEGKQAQAAHPGLGAYPVLRLPRGREG